MSVEPTAAEQYMLELINWARAHPLEQAAALLIDLNQGLAAGSLSPSARQPLIFDDRLIAVAHAHSQWMIDNDSLSHVGQGGAASAARIENAGYSIVTVGYMGSTSYGEFGKTGETIIRTDAPAASDLSALILSSHNAIFLSPAQRATLLDPVFREVGIAAPRGSFATPAGDVSSMLVTQDFGFVGNYRPAAFQTTKYLTGVVINDLDGNDFYSIGEGLGGVYITATGGGHTYTTATGSAGGYQLELPTGDYTLVFNYGHAQVTGTVSMDYLNQKVDVRLDAFWSTPDVPLTGTSASETIVADKASNFILASGGFDTIDGRTGNDIVVYRGERAEFITRLENGALLVGKPDGTHDTLYSVEQVYFNDGYLDFTVSQAGAAAYRLYGGAFDRTPDGAGLRFWDNVLSAGTSLHDVASAFLASGEFMSRYNAGANGADFVASLYYSVLHREPDAAGLDFWNGYLDQGHGDRADVLVNFTQLAEYVASTAHNVDTGYWVV